MPITTTLRKRISLSLSRAVSEGLLGKAKVYSALIIVAAWLRREAQTGPLRACGPFRTDFGIRNCGIISPEPEQAEGRARAKE